MRAGETGVFYDRDDPEALAAVVAGFDPLAVDPAVCVDAASGSAPQRFQAALRRIVDEAVAAERQPRPGDRPAVVTGLLPRRAARRRRSHRS